MTGGAPGAQEPTTAPTGEDAVRRTRPDDDGNSSGSGMESGDGERGRGAATDDETAWLRSAPKG